MILNLLVLYTTVLCQNVDKTDVNQIYGEYYFSSNNERVPSVSGVEIDSRYRSNLFIKKLCQATDNNPEYSSIYMESSNQDTIVHDNNPLYQDNWVSVREHNFQYFSLKTQRTRYVLIDLSIYHPIYEDAHVTISRDKEHNNIYENI